MSPLVLSRQPARFRRCRYLPILVTTISIFVSVINTMAQALPETENTPGPLAAGAATSNITPPLGTSINGGMRDRTATHIHDELHARALVLDNGHARLAIVTCDSCLIPRAIFDDAKHMASQHTKIPVANMLMSATHTHSAATACPAFQSDPDPAYQRFLSVRIADAVRRAVNQLEPARIGWAVAHEPDQVFNRRWYMKEGTIPPDPFGRTTDRVKMNPPRASPDLIEPAGPTDPDVSFISVQAEDGRPMALLANYALHYVGGGHGNHISADYFGMFAGRIAQLLGADHQDPPFVGILTNGASGDINNINFRIQPPKRDPYEQMRIVADDVAGAVYEATRNLRYESQVRLDARVTSLPLGVRRPDAADLERARRIIADMKTEDARTLPEIYALETMALSDYPASIDVNLQAIRIGDVGIVAIPCEVFVETGLELKEKSPFARTIIIELANAYHGYLPTPEHHELGGYETWRAKSSYLEVNAAPKIVEASLAMLNELKKEDAK